MKHEKESFSSSLIDVKVLDHTFKPEIKLYISNCQTSGLNLTYKKKCVAS